MGVASSLPGRRQRPLLVLLLLLPWLSACQFLFGDFSEQPADDTESPLGGRDGSGSCAEGTASCDGTQLFVCVDGFFSYQRDCESAELCDDSGAGRCLVCLDGAFECLDDRNSRRCEDGAWVVERPCAEGLRCDAELEQCAACRQGDGVCIGTVLCQCLEDQTGWEARTCPLGCVDAGVNDYCRDDVSVPGAALAACSGIGL